MLIKCLIRILIYFSVNQLTVFRKSPGIFSKQLKNFSQIIISEVILTEEKTYVSIQSKVCLKDRKKSYSHPIWIFNLNDLISACKPLELQANLLHPGGVNMDNKRLQAKALCFKKLIFPFILISKLINKISYIKEEYNISCVLSKTGEEYLN